MQETKKDARGFVKALEEDKALRQEAFSVPRQYLLTVAKKHGYHVTGTDLHDAMREEWADKGKVPASRDVDRDDDPDTCCACTFSESPDI